MWTLFRGKIKIFALSPSTKTCTENYHEISCSAKMNLNGDVFISHEYCSRDGGCKWEDLKAIFQKFSVAMDWKLIFKNSTDF